jgi:hypothetical protein
MILSQSPASPRRLLLALALAAVALLLAAAAQHTTSTRPRIFPARPLYFLR